MCSYPSAHVPSCTHYSPGWWSHWTWCWVRSQWASWAPSRGTPTWESREPCARGGRPAQYTCRETEGERERERERDRGRGREGDRQRVRDREWERYDTETNRQKQRFKQADRKRQTQKEIETGWGGEPPKETNLSTVRKTRFQVEDSSPPQSSASEFQSRHSRCASQPEPRVSSPSSTETEVKSRTSDEKRSVRLCRGGGGGRSEWEKGRGEEQGGQKGRVKQEEKS